ncbi:MAG: hypothetical protein KBS35_02055 [Mycoplasma sp.]|nr:hypothetical protein [Candidatus Hennigella equi]
MKKTKLLTPVIFAGALTSIITPAALLTGCSCSSRGNILTEYTPSITPLEETTFDSPALAVKTYLEKINVDKEIFKQDLMYTLTRGFPEYEAYVSEHCEIKEFNLNVSDINVISVDTNGIVTFDLVFDLKFDFTGTKKEELQWYDITAYKQDTKTKIRFKLDFNTARISPEYSAKQMTTFAGATQFGISEENSTIQLLSETGSRVDLNGKLISIDVKDGAELPFILPNKQYWEISLGKTEAEYWERYNTVSRVWYENISGQMLVLLIKYYMYDNLFNDSGKPLPNTLNFGSYYMQNANLKDLFFTVESNNKIEICSFNKSLDSIRNAKNIENSTYFNKTDGTLNFPSMYNQKPVSRIVEDAFNGGLSSYSNLGLPSNVKNLVIPGGDTVNKITIEQMAFAKNFTLQSIKFAAPTNDPTTAAGYQEIAPNAFTQLLALQTIDFSTYKTDAATLLTDASNFSGCFAGVHIGATIPEDGIEGRFYYPNGGNPAEWQAFAEDLGLKVWKKAGDIGWKLEPKTAF